jgi:hypothetical protein
VDVPGRRVKTNLFPLAAGVDARATNTALEAVALRCVPPCYVAEMWYGYAGELSVEAEEW